MKVFCFTCVSNVVKPLQEMKLVRRRKQYISKRKQEHYLCAGCGNRVVIKGDWD